MDIEIIKRNQLVDKATAELKRRFIGIDRQIDQVMAVVRTWYLYPELQQTPVVVNLYGMTGCGKTSLVKAICELLDIESDLIYYNFANIDDMTSFSVQRDIDEINNKKPNRVIVYDEFQYAATIDEHGCEKDKKGGLKPFWELLDTGRLHGHMNQYDYSFLNGLLNVIAMLRGKGLNMVIRNGCWMNEDEIASRLPFWEMNSVYYYMNRNSSGTKAKDPEDYDEDEDDEEDDQTRKFFLNSSSMYKLYDLACKYKLQCVTDKLTNRFDMYQVISGMDITAFTDFLERLLKTMEKGYDLCFNESIIFVIGNLDEAYTVSYNVNPDMSPDQFHRITSSITVVDIKRSLQKRFRNEQIARLGNTHILYPAFSSESFRKIISAQLEEYGQIIQKKFGYELHFGDALKRFIYDESVFPVQGVRPILSGIQEIVKSKLAATVMLMDGDGIRDKVTAVEYDYCRGYLTGRFMDASDSTVCNKKIAKVESRINGLRKSKSDESQAIVAAHESGHFVVYSYFYPGCVPERLVSRTADSESQGFMIEEDNQQDFASKRDMLNKIKVLLGGYAAEMTVFGPDMLTAGSADDLNKATRTAMSMVRQYGMGGQAFVSTKDISLELVNEEDQQYINDQVKCIINDCLNEDMDLFKNNTSAHDMLKESAIFLSTHSAMTKQKMSAMIKKYFGDRSRSGHYYRDCIDRM